MRRHQVPARRRGLPLLAGLAGLAGLAALVGALLLALPAAAQEAVSIARAQAALEAARSTRAVRVLAAPALDAAELALERARAARDAGEACAEVEHLAYLAERRAAIARVQARERGIARALRSLSATHDLMAQARAGEAAAAERRARALAERLAGFEVGADADGLLLTPREPWFEHELAPSPRALRAIAEAATLLGELPGRQVVVLGHVVSAAETQVVDHLQAGYRKAAAAPAIDRDDLGCARAEVVRAHLIGLGLDPRRIVARCVAPDGDEAPAGRVTGIPVGVTGIAIVVEGGPDGAAAFGR